MSEVFLVLFSLFISHIARYAPSSQKENHPKIQTETDAACFLHVTKKHPTKTSDALRVCAEDIFETSPPTSIGTECQPS